MSKGAVENVQEIYAQEKSFSGVVSSQTLCLEKVKEHILRMRRIMAGYMGGHEICHSGCGKNGNGI